MSESPNPDTRDALALAEYRPGASAVLSDAERWPTLSTEGAARLDRWRTHPHAPAWVHATGDRLRADQVERASRPLPTEGWLDDHLATARRLIRYRRLAAEGRLARLEDFPVVSRADLVADVAAFVPQDADLSRLVHGSSSGSTGAALQIPDDVEEVARGFHLLVDLVRAEGVDWRPDGERMALAHLVHQRQAFTYVSIVSGFGQRAMVRLNLHESAWQGSGQAPDASRRAFLEAADPQVVTGNPTSLAELLAPDLAGAVRPLAIFSGAMALSAPLRAELEQRFACPVFDVYGLHETRPIAVRTDDGPFRVLDRRVHVEVLDGAGAPVPVHDDGDGEVGELVVTAGENPLLPLVRYRTGDFGRLVRLHDGALAIADLEGREHTRFVAGDGRLVPCVDLTQQLQAHGALGWSVAQAASGEVSAHIAGGDAGAVRAALTAILSQPVVVDRVERVSDLGEGKPRRYRSDAGEASA
ncbi:CoF synthetase [Agromyces protaetiae]|uniref:CoF synthetase n=1 Tax=Agromyces protaetiae TaxID=2509455 RepID=A0A4P6FS76_9MICO|nr:AMP-binding protein [Agromyces protaetiae]QAY73388.1 CoF synthetase [Agromyces protaetiae]